MFDAHIHIGRKNGAKITSPRLQTIRSLLSTYRDLGFSLLRDGGDKELCGILAREVAPEYGIELKTPVFAFSKKKGYGGFIGRQFTSLNDIKKGLSYLAEYKPDYIKVIQSGIVSFDTFGHISAGGFSESELRYICEYAKDHSLKVMAHCNGAENIDIAISAGVNSVEHGYFIGEIQLQAMAELNIVWVPTFVPLSNYLKSFPDSKQSTVIEMTLAQHAESLRSAFRTGVPVAVGSDAGAACVPHAQGALLEYEIFIKAGISCEAVENAQKSSITLLFPDITKND